MRQTLFFIPYEAGSVPLFGVGLLLALWAVFCVGIVVWLRRRGVEWGEVLGQVPLLVLIGAALIFLPKLFPGDGLPVRGYGVLMVLGVAGGVGLAMHRARQMGIDPDLIFSLAFWLFVGGIVGARAFHVIQKWGTEYQRDTWQETLIAVINVPQGGLVVYGALIGAALGFVLFVRKYRLPPLPLADLIAPSLLVGLALGRVGCLMNGCCFGGSCDLPWAVTFPPESPPFARQVEEGTLHVYGIQWHGDPVGPPVIRAVEPGSAAERAGLQAGDRIARVDGHQPASMREAQYRLIRALVERAPVEIVTTSNQEIELLPPDPAERSLPIHPTQLYSAIGATLLCLFLLAYYPYRRRDGEVVVLLLALHAVMRFLEEGIRVDERGALGTSLSISQLISIAILVAAAALGWYVSRQARGSMLPVRAS